MKVAEKVKKPTTGSFDIGGVLVALELGKTDSSILNYLNFLAETFSISEIETGNYPPVYRMNEMMKASSDAGQQETIAPGEMEVSSKVTVGFHLNQE